MKLPLLLIISWASAAALGQQPAATPKSDPFAGFGHTSLDRSGGKTVPSGLDKGPASPFSPNQKTFAPQTGMQTGSGIVLAGDWQGHMAESSGGQTMKLADLRALITGFGMAEADIAPHPDATVYEGQKMDGAPGDNCRVTYLMPLPQAEAQLFHSRGLTTASRAVAPGLPDGLFLHTYDVRAGIYNRLCIVTDSARPEPQVVSMVLTAEGANYYPAQPFHKIERDWHTFDYVNTENRGQSALKIDTRVNDARKTSHCIVVNMTGRNPGVPMPDELTAPLVLKPARFSPKATTTWYVPEPMIKLMLYCLANQSGR